MPSLGQWDGPIYGRLGGLQRDETSVQCHACGGRFAFLPGHLGRAHDLTCDEYRAIFGLNKGAALVSLGLSATHQERALRMRTAGRLHNVSPWAMEHLTTEWLSHRSRTRKTRLETRVLLDSREHREKRSRAISEARGGKRQRTCVVCEAAFGSYNTDAKTCGAPCLAELRRRINLARFADPVRKAALREKILQSVATRGSELRACVVCGTEFRIGKADSRKTCSRACHMRRLADAARERGLGVKVKATGPWSKKRG